MNETKNIVLDKWLSGIFAREVYKVVVDDEFITGSEQERLSELCNKPVFVYSKVPVEPLDYVQFLEGLDFGLVDTQVIFEKRIANASDFSGNCVLRFAEPADHEKVRELAEESFECSRFHLDPKITVQTASRIKAQWAANYFAGNRGQQMIVSEIEGRIVGFAQLLYIAERSVAVDLIAVDKKVRRKGIGCDMLRYAECHHQRFEKICVGTQVANTASIRLYEKFGFRFVGANYTFHFHGPD